MKLKQKKIKPVEQLTALEIENIDSPTLRRLVREVQNKTPDSIYAFDRVHTRHNR